MTNQDRLNEINDQIIVNLEKQISNFQEIVKIDDTLISQLEKALEVAKGHLQYIGFGTAPETTCEFDLVERAKIALKEIDTITKDTKGE